MSSGSGGAVPAVNPLHRYEGLHGHMHQVVTRWYQDGAPGADFAHALSLVEYFDGHFLAVCYRVHSGLRTGEVLVLEEGGFPDVAAAMPMFERAVALYVEREQLGTRVYESDFGKVLPEGTYLGCLTMAEERWLWSQHRGLPDFEKTGFGVLTQVGVWQRLEQRARAGLAQRLPQLLDDSAVLCERLHLRLRAAPWLEHRDVTALAAIAYLYGEGLQEGPSELLQLLAAVDPRDAAPAPLFGPVLRFLARNSKGVRELQRALTAGLREAPFTSQPSAVPRRMSLTQWLLAFAGPENRFLLGDVGTALP